MLTGDMSAFVCKYSGDQISRYFFNQLRGDKDVRTCATACCCIHLFGFYIVQFGYNNPQLLTYRGKQIIYFGELVFAQSDC